MTKKAFTLVEIIVTMVVVAIIAAWGVPSYNRSLVRTKAQSLLQDMRLIHAANITYRARNNKNFCEGQALCSINAINNMNGQNSLSLNPSSGVVLSCTGTGVAGPAIGTDVCVATGPAPMNTLVIFLSLNCPPSETPIANCWDDGNFPNPRCSNLVGSPCP